MCLMFVFCFFFLMIRRPPRSTLDRSSAASDVYKRQEQRKARKLVETEGAVATDFDRATFLLSKQLMYFERYGKMYMRDVSLFDLSLIHISEPTRPY